MAISSAHFSLWPHASFFITLSLTLCASPSRSLETKAIEPTEIKKGLEQRAQALRSFVIDLHSAERGPEKSGILPNGFMDRLLARHLAQEWIFQLKPEDVSFAYAPDLARDSDGRFRIVRDHFGPTAGIAGPLDNRAEALAQSIVLASESAEATRPAQQPPLFFKKLLERYQERAKQREGILVLLLDASARIEDHDSMALNDLFKSAGIKIVEMKSLRGREFQGKLILKADDSGVYLVEPGRANKTRVAYVATSIEGLDIDPTNHNYRKKRLLSEVKALQEEASLDSSIRKSFDLLLNQSLPKFEPDYDALEIVIRSRSRFAHGLDAPGGIPGFWKAFELGKVGTSNPPVLASILSDPELFKYMDALVAHYTGKPALLSNAEGQPPALFRIPCEVGPESTLVSELPTP